MNWGYNVAMPLNKLPRIVATNSAPCVKAAAPAGSWRAGKTSSERGYGTRWSKARATYLAKHPLCTYCAQEGRTVEATVLDHIAPHQGDMALFWDAMNWQGLCKRCHDSVKAREEAVARGVRYEPVRMPGKG